MSWTAPHTWYTGDLSGEAAALTADLHDNMLLTEAAVATTAQQLFRATGPNAIEAFGVGSNGQILVSDGTTPAPGTTASMAGLLGSVTVNLALTSATFPNEVNFTTAGMPRITFEAPDSGVCYATAAGQGGMGTAGYTCLAIIDQNAADVIAASQLPGNLGDSLSDASAAEVPGTARTIVVGSSLFTRFDYFALLSQSVDASSGSGQYLALVPGQSYTFTLSAAVTGSSNSFLSLEFAVWAAPTGVTLG